MPAEQAFDGDIILFDSADPDLPNGPRFFRIQGSPVGLVRVAGSLALDFSGTGAVWKSNGDGTWVSLTGDPPPPPPEQVLISAADTTAGYLDAKLTTSTDGVTLVVTDPTANESLSLDIATATELLQGLIELATQAQTNTGTDDTRAVTPLKLAQLALGGQLGGVLSDPDVRGLRETGGPTRLAMGAVADGQYLRRVGNALEGAAAPGVGDWNGVLSNGATSGGVSPILSDGDTFQGEDLPGVMGGIMAIRGGNNVGGGDNGGPVEVDGGSGEAGGDVTVQGGSATVDVGGTVTVQGGLGGTEGGPVNLLGGLAPGGQGGQVTVRGADGDPPGQVFVRGGDDTAGGGGARVLIQGGDGGAQGGDVEVVPGNLGNVLVGTGAPLAVGAVNGFMNIPTIAGPPVGVPTTYPGMVPMAYDTANNRLYIYNGAWVSAAFA